MSRGTSPIVKTNPTGIRKRAHPHIGMKPLFSMIESKPSDSLWDSYRAHWINALCLVLLFGVIIGIYWDSLTAGEFWWTDEARHAMDGVFFRDFIIDWPWRTPTEYALRYFGQYPAIAPNWYPPFYAIIEALFYSAFGISDVAAHLTILAFALLGAVVWYFWSCRFLGRTAALLSCLLYLSAPAVLIWTRSIMLEVPAVSMIILSAYAFDRYLERPALKSACFAGIAVALTLLLKQTTVFIIPVLLVYAVISGKREALIRRDTVIAYLIVSATLLALFLHALYFGTTATKTIVGSLATDKAWNASLFKLKRWGSHVLALWDTSSFLFLLAIFGGGLSLLRYPPRRQDFLFLLWIAGWYFMTTAMIPATDAKRYTMYVLPAIAGLACRPFADFIPAETAIKRVALLVVGAAVAWNLLSAWRSEPLFISGYKEAAHFVQEQKISGPILFAGRHDGNFIFHLRAEDKDRKKIVLRGDKVLVSMAVNKDFGVKSYVDNQSDIVRILDKYGIGLIIVESRDLVGLREFAMLHALLREPRFELLKTIPLKTNVPHLSNTEILIFRYLDQAPSREDSIVIPLPHLNREITFESQQP